jgi:hypothetical protein
VSVRDGCGKGTLTPVFPDLIRAVLDLMNSHSSISANRVARPLQLHTAIVLI